MDRIDAMQVFVTALDEGSLAAAGHRLGRSPAAVTRAIHFLEDRLGQRLLHRTTRAITLTEAGNRYAATCRRVLADLVEADLHAAGRRVSRSTVYRTLRLLVEAGLLRELRLTNRTVYEHDYGYPSHDHLHCSECNTIVEFRNDEIRKLRTNQDVAVSVNAPDALLVRRSSPPDS